MFAAAMRLWVELRRRRVIRTTIAYIVGAWVLIEAASVVFPAMLLPEWSIRIVIAIAVLALPLVIVLAWMFDIAPNPDAAMGHVIVETADVQATGPTNENSPPFLESAIASIAVLPLKNLSANEEHEFLADGISTELHSALAKVHRLRVAARTSTFAYRDSTESVKKIARALKVQYVVSGDVQCINDQMRVHVSLDNAIEGMQIWSESYSRNLSDVFSVQQDIALSVANAFGGARLREEIASVAGQPTSDLNAWSLVQRARSYVLAFTPEALEEAIPLLRKAIELDNDYAAAHAALAFLLAEQFHNGMAKNGAESQALEHAERAHALAPIDPFVLKMCGATWAYFGALDKSLQALRLSVKKAPFDFGAWGYLGWPLVATGEDDDLAELHEIMQRILKATPQHPGAPYWLYHRSAASSCSGQVDDAITFIRLALERNPAFPWGLMQYANALGSAGNVEAANNAVNRSLELNPELTLAHYKKMIHAISSSNEVADRRLAGLNYGVRVD